MMGRHLVLASLVIGCGPVVDAAAETDSTSTADATTVVAESSTGVPQPDPDSGPIPDPVTDSGPDSTSAPGPTTDDTDATTSDDDDTFDDTSCAFLCEPDGGIIDIECDVWAQDCPRGEKCMPWANDGGSAWNATRCSPVSDSPVEVGDPCVAEGSGVSGIDNCELGAMCFGVDDETLEGTCVALCYGSVDQPMCDEGMVCTASSDSVINLCLPMCNPIEQNCAEGEACYPFVDTFVCSPVFESATFGEACESVAGCDPGLFCAPPEAVPACESDVGCCSAYCDFSVMNASETCPGVAGGQECLLWWEEGQAPPGLENVGACVIPD